MSQPQSEAEDREGKVGGVWLGILRCRLMDAIRNWTQPVGTDGDWDEIGEATSSFRFGLASLALMVGPLRRLFFQWWRRARRDSMRRWEVVPGRDYQNLPLSLYL
jgi:hypothetical protein